MLYVFNDSVLRFIFPSFLIASSFLIYIYIYIEAKSKAVVMLITKTRVTITIYN
jgi:hypothetical protein